MLIRSLITALALLTSSLVAIATTGKAVPDLAAYDTEIQSFMARWQVPGASLAVVRNGKLVFARGYGMTEVDGSTAVQPTALFRVASVSKPITSATVMKLVEDGLLSLDLKVFPYLARGTATDERLNTITVRHLLEHTGGWDRDLAGDPMFKSRQIAQTMGVASPPDADTVLRWMLMQPLQFNPGSRFAYSNFGYLVLGQVLAKASGQSYEDLVRALLMRSGVTHARLGASLAAGRLSGEVSYAMPANYPLANSVFGSSPSQVPWPYGGFAIEPMAAHGGWVASAIDLVAFAAALDGDATRTDMLSASSLTETARRPAHVAANASYWYAKGWSVNTNGHWWHDGSLPGTTALLVKTSIGMQWAVLLNTRSETNPGGMVNDLDNAMWVAYRAVSNWPTEDQFPALQGSVVQLSATAGPGRISLSFAAPSFTGGAPIVSYTGTCSATGQASKSASGADSPLVVSGLTANVAYNCTVTASNGSYTSAPSAAVSATPGKAADLTPILMLLLD